MQDMPQLCKEHRELLALAREVLPGDPITPASAERARKKLALLGERLNSHFIEEAETIGRCCGVGGADAVACSIREREVEALKESVSGLIRRWGQSGAIERDYRVFASTWEVVIAALVRLHAREEGDIYPHSEVRHDTPLVAPPPTGLPGIDRDHDAMFATIGGLRAAVGGGQKRADPRMIADLASYVERHFADEEAIMEATSFPGIDDHRAEHHLARTILLGYRNDHLEGRPVEAAAILAFLERWLVSHISLVDMAMAKHAFASGWKA